jgi:hypothetical protein
MGIGSAFLTNRTDGATRTIRKNMERQWAVEASAPAVNHDAVIVERSGNR